MTYPNNDLFTALDTGRKITGPTNANGELIISYYFGTQGESFNVGGFNTDHADTSWTSYEQQRIEAAMGTYEQVINVEFVRTNSLANADLKFFAGETGTTGQVYNSPLFLGFAIIPGFLNSGYISFNVDAVGWDRSSSAGDSYDGGLAEGGLGYETIIHELGHALGLYHPFDNGLFPGLIDNNNDGVADQPYSDTGDFGLNQTTYTIMSYVRGWTGHPDGTRLIFSDGLGGFILEPGGFTASPMALDIAALQQIYGANNDHALGDDVYFLSDVNGIGTSYQAIWDKGGNDTIAYNGIQDAVINLQSATLEVENGGGGFVSYVDNILGGFTIANGSEIENAIGGAGNDILIGNELGNTLLGRDGNDVLFSGFGSSDIDVMEGGNGSDSYVHTFETTQLSIFDNGNGTLDRLFMDFNLDLAGLEILTNPGWDALYFLYGLNQSNFTVIVQPQDIEEYHFNDGTIINDFNENNPDGGTYVASNANNYVEGSMAVDILHGLAGDDYLIGGGGNDELYGYEGADHLIGGRGNDILNIGANSGNGIDIASGGLGNDHYYYQASVTNARFMDAPFDSYTDRVILTDLAYDDVEITLSGNDVFFRHIHEGGQHELHVVETTHFNNFEFADGRIINIFLQAEATGSSVYGYVQNDYLLGSNAQDSLNGDVGNDILIGLRGNDELNGDEGDDLLFGDEGADLLRGGDGNDLMDIGTDSGTGTDRAFGGQGNDHYIYRATVQSAEFTDILYDSSDDRVIFEDLMLRDLSLSFQGDQLTITHDFQGFINQLTITNHKTMNTYEFLDGQIINSFRVGSESGGGVYGFNANDYMLGSDFDDVFKAKGGDDVIETKDGNDLIKIDMNFGHDVIIDFDSSRDRIEFSRDLFEDYDAVMASTSLEAGNTVITYDENNSLTIEDKLLADLAFDDFAFV